MPNAPYIFTDLIHLGFRPPVPFWFDMFLVLITAFNGLIMRFISLRQVESILDKNQLMKHKEIFRIVVIIAMSYGVYMGRYLRFNFWDAFRNPHTILIEVIHSFDAGTLVYMMTFSFVIYVLYKFFHFILPSPDKT